MATPLDELNAFLAMHCGHLSAARRDHLKRQFDALLAEHRAEVERLEAQVAEARRMLGAQHEVSGCRAMHTALRAEHSCTLDHIREKETITRNAAREEAERVARAKCFCQPDYRDPECNVHEAAEDIRALKARPSERYLRESEVKAALGEMRDHPSMWDERTANEAARRLGIDLDAKAEKSCPYYTEHHPRLTSCHSNHTKDK